MKEINFEITAREKTGKSDSKNLRSLGKIPAIIYGDKKDPTHISLDYPKFSKEISKSNFFSTVFNLKLDKKEVKVLPREIQTDPVNDKPIHIDFLRVNDNSKINISVPIIFINEEKSPGLKGGGVLNVVRREVDLICKIKTIPEKLVADLSNLEVGSVIHMSDITLEEGVSPQISDRDFTLATIAAPTVMAVEEEETKPEGEEGEEGEERVEGKEGAEGKEEKEGEENKEENKNEEKKEEEPKK